MNNFTLLNIKYEYTRNDDSVSFYKKEQIEKPESPPMQSIKPPIIKKFIPLPPSKTGYIGKPYIYKNIPSTISQPKVSFSPTIIKPYDDNTASSNSVDGFGYIPAPVSFTLPQLNSNSKIDDIDDPINNLKITFSDADRFKKK